MEKSCEGGVDLPRGRTANWGACSHSFGLEEVVGGWDLASALTSEHQYT